MIDSSINLIRANSRYVGTFAPALYAAAYYSVTIYGPGSNGICGLPVDLITA